MLLLLLRELMATHGARMMFIKPLLQAIAVELVTTGQFGSHFLSGVFFLLFQRVKTNVALFALAAVSFRQLIDECSFRTLISLLLLLLLSIKEHREDIEGVLTRLLLGLTLCSLLLSRFRLFASGRNFNSCSLLLLTLTIRISQFNLIAFATDAFWHLNVAFIRYVDKGAELDPALSAVESARDHSAIFFKRIGDWVAGTLGAGRLLRLLALFHLDHGAVGVGTVETIECAFG